MNAAAPFLFDRLEATLSELSHLVARLRESTENASPPVREPQAEYLSVKQLASRIPYREQTIRNFVSAGEFREGVHYYKRRGRVMFRWSEVERWLSERPPQSAAEAPFYPVHHARTRKEREAVL
jgi:hypothetical protein